MNDSNGCRFVVTFNALDQALRTKGPTWKGHPPFYQVVDALKGSVRPVRDHEMALKRFADLRNAIVHGETRPDHIIAESHDDVLVELEGIYAAIVDPDWSLARPCPGRSKGTSHCPRG